MARAPDNLRFAYQLAWLLAAVPEKKLRNGGEAVKLALQVCQQSGYRIPAALDLLAAACAENGRFDKARETADQAHQLAISSGQPQLAKQIQSRQKLYNAGKPYREGKDRIIQAR